MPWLDVVAELGKHSVTLKHQPSLPHHFESICYSRTELVIKDSGAFEGTV